MKNVGMVLMFLIVSSFIWINQKSNLLKVSFVDEQDNFVVAQNLIEGNKLYSNIFSHHQPGTYLLSAVFQKISNPNTILQLMKQHRQLVVFWSIGWMAFLLCRFGKTIIIPTTILELIKHIYLGNMFLAESLLVMPVIYLVLLTLQNKKISTVEIFFLGIVVGMIAITLAPLWPLLAVVAIGWIYRLKNSLKKVILMLSGATMFPALALVFVDLEGYFKNAILINQKYYIPIAGGENLFLSLLKAIATPFTYLFSSSFVPEVVVVKVMIGLLLAMVVKLIYEKRFVEVGTMWGIITLANLRNFEMKDIFFNGFHLLIWIGLVIFIPFFLWKSKFKNIIGILLIGFLLFLYKDKMLKAPNLIEDFEIYYSRIFNMSEAIRLTRNDSDRLLSMPDIVLGYWQGEIKPAGRFIFFYKWMTKVEELKNEQMKNFESRPEYLIIGNNEGLEIDGILNEYENFGYRGSNSSEFYIRDDIYKSFTKEKVDRLRYYGLEANGDKTRKN